MSVPGDEGVWKGSQTDALGEDLERSLAIAEAHEGRGALHLQTVERSARSEHPSVPTLHCRAAVGELTRSCEDTSAQQAMRVGIVKLIKQFRGLVEVTEEQGKLGAPVHLLIPRATGENALLSRFSQMTIWDHQDSSQAPVFHKPSSRRHRFGRWRRAWMVERILRETLRSLGVPVLREFSGQPKNEEVTLTPTGRELGSKKRIQLSNSSERCQGPQLTIEKQPSGGIRLSGSPNRNEFRRKLAQPMVLVRH